MNEETFYKTPDGQRIKILAEESYTFQITPEQSEWQCYMFGNRPGLTGIIYRPNKGKEPNWFVRWMMRVCFDCLWIKDKK